MSPTRRTKALLPITFRVNRTQQGETKFLPVTLDNQLIIMQSFIIKIIVSEGISAAAFITARFELTLPIRQFNRHKSHHFSLWIAGKVN